MQIEISDEAAHFLQSKALQAGFDSVEAYLLHLVKEQETDRGEGMAMSYEQWRDEYGEFVARQTSRNPQFDDSRESIYMGP